MIETYVLTWMTFLPLAGAAVIFCLPSSAHALIRWTGVAATVPSLLLSCWLLGSFDPANTAPQFVHRFGWIPSYNIEYFLGVDGISITMVALTALLSFLCMFASFGITKAVKGYFALFLLLETGMMGTFLALDFFLFYVFWEVMLLPMYFLIGIWGGPRREYAAIKFFLYTLLGSVLMLVVMLAMYFTVPDQNPALAGHQGTFSFITLREVGPKLFQGGWWFAAFVGLYIGFAIKVPA